MVVVYPAQTTPAPDVNLVNRQLASRQEYTATCGWMSADPLSPNICYPGQTCAVNTFYSVHECCSGAQCTDTPFPTACVGTSTSCDSNCQNNALIAKCTVPGFDSCATRIWAGSLQFSGFGCTTGGAILQTVYTTNTAGVGETAAWYAFGEQVAVASTSPTFRSALSTSPSSTTSRLPSNTTTIVTTSTGTNSGGMSSSSVTALAAALGVIVGLGLLSIICFLVYRKRRRSNQQKPNEPSRFSAIPKGSGFPPYSISSTSQSEAFSTPVATPDMSSYRGSERPNGFHDHYQAPFELDGNRKVSELYDWPTMPIEADGASLFEAPPRRYR